MLSDADRDELPALQDAGIDAERQVCRYADWLISTSNTRSPQQQAERAGDGVPDPHPCSVNPFTEGPVDDDYALREDLDGLINCCQRHVCRPEGYCKKNS